jgi:hypothetical protein
MPGKNFAIIVASPRARTGKTLLARLIADHFLLHERRIEIFDTDAVEKSLTASFPESSVVIDLDRTVDQMKLFDTLAAPMPESQVIDLTHRSFQKFFKLMRDADYVAEAKARGIEPVIFYIPDRDVETYEQGRNIRDFFHDAAFVLTENAFLGELAKDTRRSESYLAFKNHRPLLEVPTLDPFLTGVVMDPALSLSEFMRRARATDPAAPLTPPPGQQSLAYLSRETRAGLTAWLKPMFAKLDAVLNEINERPMPSRRDPFGP